MSSNKEQAKPLKTKNNPKNHKDNPLWPVLVETVQKMVMYPHYKAYTRDTILQENPSITPQELSVRLNTSLGAAIVILQELESSNTNNSKNNRLTHPD